MSQHSNNQPVRLTLPNQPSREGRYADIGEPHRDGVDAHQPVRQVRPDEERDGQPPEQM